MKGKHYDMIVEDDMVSNSGSITTTTNTGDWYEYTTTPYQEPIVSIPILNKKGDDDMRYLYEVILVNPKNDAFYVDRVVAKSETSALMKAYEYSDFNATGLKIEFDDLKTSCRVLMEWKKEKSLKKAIETIKKAVE